MSVINFQNGSTTNNVCLKVVGRDNAVITLPATTVNPTVHLDGNVLTMCLAPSTAPVVPAVSCTFRTLDQINAYATLLDSSGAMGGPQGGVTIGFDFANTYTPDQTSFTTTLNNIKAMRGYYYLSNQNYSANNPTPITRTYLGTFDLAPYLDGFINHVLVNYWNNFSTERYDSFEIFNNVAVSDAPADLQAIINQADTSLNDGATANIFSLSIGCEAKLRKDTNGNDIAAIVFWSSLTTSSSGRTDPVASFESIVETCVQVDSTQPAYRLWSTYSVADGYTVAYLLSETPPTDMGTSALAGPSTVSLLNSAWGLVTN